MSSDRILVGSPLEGPSFGQRAGRFHAGYIIASALNRLEVLYKQRLRQARELEVVKMERDRHKAERDALRAQQDSRNMVERALKQRLRTWVWDEYQDQGPEVEAWIDRKIKRQLERTSTVDEVPVSFVNMETGDIRRDLSREYRQALRERQLAGKSPHLRHSREWEQERRANLEGAMEVDEGEV